MLQRSWFTTCNNYMTVIFVLRGIFVVVCVSFDCCGGEMFDVVVFRPFLNLTKFDNYIKNKDSTCYTHQILSMEVAMFFNISGPPCISTQAVNESRR